MSDYYNENDNRYYYGYGAYPNPPQQPQRPVQPPQAPPMYSGYNPPPAPPSPAPQPQPVNIPPAPVAPPVTPPPVAPAPQTPPPAPVRNNAQYAGSESIMNTSPYRTPNTPPMPRSKDSQKDTDSDKNSSNPPKQPMGPGLKALLIIIVTFLFVSLAGFIAYLSLSSETQQGFVPSEEKPSATESTYYYNYDFDDDDEPATSPKGNYEESDAKDKTNKDYAGLKLNNKPKKVAPGKSGSSYAFSQVEKSVVGLIAYVDGQKGTATSYTQMGTGVIATSDGYIITNAHLLDYSRTAYKYKVITNDKKEYDAGIVGYDSRSDLAVLKIDAKGLTPASFGDSAQIEVTDDVIAVGNPLSLNYQNSVTKGIVSAVDRQVSITNNVKCIQTDAAINPGNSGGPLCNMYGQVIGITNSKIALDDYEGMGFAIPSSLVKSITDDIIRYSYVQGRVKIGIIGEVDYLNASSYDTAICVKEIIEDGPMDGSGIKVGDFITEVDGKKVTNFADIYDILENYRPGEKVTVTVYRPGDDKNHDFKVVLEADEP